MKAEIIYKEDDDKNKNKAKNCQSYGYRETPGGLRFLNSNDGRGRRGSSRSSRGNAGVKN